MIALQSDCLIFQLTNGESVPCSAEMITVEIVGNADGMIATGIAASCSRASVFHYFKIEMSRETVTVGEFATSAPGKSVARARPHTFCGTGGVEVGGVTDPGNRPGLLPIALESSDNLELFFVPRLRNELRAKLRLSPRVVHFRGLRGCAKRLAGAQRWSARCEKMQEQIVGYLRECLVAEPEQKECALVVE